MIDLKSNYDCVVVGGGPAGSTVAAIIAAAGRSTLLVERERMPRPHVGESLMPETYWTFKRIGVLDKLKASGFAKKVGVQFVTNTGRESAPFFFRSHDDRECSETWHVDRAEFDKMMFDNAAEKGATCLDGFRALEVFFENERAVGARLQDVADKSVAQVAATVVVDATGQQAMIANRLGLKRENPRLRKAAIWRHYRGGDRDEQGGGVKTIILHTAEKKSWFWYIPQGDDLVSVGVVGDRDYLLRERGAPENVFAEELQLCHGVRDRLENASPCDDLVVAKEFSYCTEQSAGDGWVLVGDAWGFIDPVYSSGVYFAVKSAELAADAIVEGLDSGDTSAKQLGRWLPDFTQRTQLVRKLVHAFYSGEFRVGRFIAEYPQHQRELVDLLIGRIFGDHPGNIFRDLEPWLERAASRDDNSEDDGDDAAGDPGVPAIA